MRYTAGMQPLSLYVHIPFCRHRCGYCDFNTYAGMSHLIPAYISGLKTEIRGFEHYKPVQDDYLVHTIYFGGGTPSLLSPSDMGEILGQIDQIFRVDGDCEITMEANPGTVSLATLEGYRQQGVNRISLGVQSSNLGELQLLERQHEFFDVKRAVEDARSAGVSNISLDLIFGIPGQSMESWQQSLVDVTNLAPDHLSLYSLTIEEGTPFAKYVRDGKMVAPDGDIAADMYDLAREFLGSKDFQQYEISNWAKRNETGELIISRHNHQYWLNGAYIGFGAGAHGSIGGARLENEKSIIHYIRALVETSKHMLPATGATKGRTPISTEREMNETVMLGLRLLLEGVSAKRFEHRFGESLRKVFGKTIEMLEAKNLVEWGGPAGDTLRLTERGYLLGNQVFIEFV